MIVHCNGAPSLDIIELFSHITPMNCRQLVVYSYHGYREPEDHWSCIAHLIAEDMLKSAFIEEKTFKHSPWAGADNPLGPKF